MKTRDHALTTNSGIVNLYPTKGTHWVMFVDTFYIDSYGCQPPVNVMNQINRGIYSEYQIQKNDSYCAVVLYCLYVLYPTQGMGLQNAVFISYYHTKTDIFMKFRHYQMRTVKTYSAQNKIISPK